jgi:predicted RNA-binding protein YlqC (UPF0109 family)
MAIATDHKEVLDYRERHLKRKIEEITRDIMVVREDFLNFLRVNNIDPNYPIVASVTADPAVPDTAPEQSMESIPIEQAMLPNIPNDTFLKTMNLLQDKYVTFQGEIEEYTDQLYKMRLHRAQLEGTLEGVKKASEEYQSKIKENQKDYDQTVSNLDKIKYLYISLLNFKYLFSSLPDVMTAESYMRFKTNNLNKYSSNYSTLKKTIKITGDMLQESYTTTAFDQIENGVYVTVFKDISIYFDSEQKDSLPVQYVDAISMKKDIMTKLEVLSNDLDKLISNNIKTLDAIRGVKGIGNSMVEGLVTSTIEISNSFAAAKKVEQTTLDTVKSGNYTVGEGVNRKIKDIKSRVQGGIENLDEKFIKAQRNILRKIALTFGFPVKSSEDRNTNLEEHLRERVRQKYGGNIPFCDEVETIDSSGNKVFIKKEAFDEKTGKSKKDTSSDILEFETRINRDIMSH